jgi:hypothetical protein
MVAVEVALTGSVTAAPPRGRGGCLRLFVWSTPDGTGGQELFGLGVVELDHGPGLEALLGPGPAGEREDYQVLGHYTGVLIRNPAPSLVIKGARANSTGYTQVLWSRSNQGCRTAG